MLLLEWDIEMKNRRVGRGKDLIWGRQLMEEGTQKVGRVWIVRPIPLWKMSSGPTRIAY